MSSEPQEHSVYVRRRHKLPVWQLTILSICRFSEPIASTSLMPYLPQMLESFNISSDDVGGWVGVCAAAFSIAQGIMGIPWGRFSDIYGRKPSILLGIVVTLFAVLLWGFSPSLSVAILARAIAGAANGNVGVIRTTVAEMVPWKELQPRAFSLMPLIWNVGSIFGPILGGALANPLGVEPGERNGIGSLFERFPYALPNIVSAILFLVGFLAAWLFLEETLEGRSRQYDYGLNIGKNLVMTSKNAYRRLKNWFNSEEQRNHDIYGESSPLIISPNAVQQPEYLRLPPVLAPHWDEVLTKQSSLNLLVYFFLAMHTMVYDGFLPVLLQEKKQAVIGDNILHFFGGLHLTSFRIGIINTCYGIFGMLMQAFVYPPVASKLGNLYCLKWCAIVFPICYVLTPFTSLLPTQTGRIAACFIIQLIKGFATLFAYPSAQILTSNSANSQRILGTLNGFVTLVSAFGRAIGPVGIGALYNWGSKTGYLIIPWWTLAFVAMLGSIPVFSLIDGPGFADADDDNAERGIAVNSSSAAVTDGDDAGQDSDNTIRASRVKAGRRLERQPSPNGSDCTITQRRIDREVTISKHQRRMRFNPNAQIYSVGQVGFEDLPRLNENKQPGGWPAQDRTKPRLMQYHHQKDTANRLWDKHVQPRIDPKEETLEQKAQRFLSEMPSIVKNIESYLMKNCTARREYPGFDQSPPARRRHADRTKKSLHAISESQLVPRDEQPLISKRAS